MTLVIFTNVLVLMHPQRAYAIPVEVVTDATAEREAVLEKIEKSLIAGGLGALVNGASYFMRKLAYDGAKYLASGGSGQGALAFQDGFGEYLKNTGDEAAGAAIEQLGKPFGLNLCTPPDIRYNIMLQVSLSNIYDQSGGPQKPNCSWTKFSDTWFNEDYWKDNYTGDALAERFSASLDVTEGDFGVALSALGRIDRNVSEHKEANLLERMIGDGFKPVKEFISGDILTPSQTIKEESKALTGKHQGEQSNQQIAGIYAAEAYQIFPTALSIFANTFISTLLQNIMNDGLLPSRSDDANVIDPFASNINYNREAAERAFSYFNAGNPQIDATAYDLVVQYSTCPDSPGLNNCVMDSGLVQAVQRAKNGEALTISEAIDLDLLHGNWKLLPPSRESDNTDIGCYNRGYCYSNVQKLRKAGIVPIGFEVAILKSNPDNPVTLGDVVEKFYECNNDPINPIPDPYCHLIDPNWLVKAPLAQCTSKVNGAELLSENTAQRREECADFSTCLSYDSNGSCNNNKYGYCTKERNIWHIPGDSCEEPFDTCRTFTNETTGDIGSYLTRSVDYGSCNAESVGCRAYSLEQDIDGEWLDSSQVDIENKFDHGRNQVAYFNQNVGTCGAVDNGCNLYVDDTTDQQIFLKKAPDYLGCYDINPTTPQIEWASSTADLTLLDEIPEQCNNFAGACIAEEVGCESYSPQDGGFDVTGIVTPQNVCQQECVGYDTFKQEKTVFEPSRFPLHFIPSRGEACEPVYKGCDAFVSLSDDTGESLAYFSNTKHCARPDGDNSKVFYTWEGSDSEGYVLKKHTLLKDSDGTPAYNGIAEPALTDRCNETSYNALLENIHDPAAAPVDCRAYYDDAGVISYRLKEYTVTVSDQCRPYRKVEPFFEDDGECTHGGGIPTEVNGVKECVYNTILSEAQVCPATANKCREYIGNTGNNIFEVYSRSFEPGENTTSTLDAAMEGWIGDVSVVPEATQVGLYSLRIDSDTAQYDFATGTLREGIHYEVSFWARGTGQQLEVSLRGDSDSVYFTRDLQTGQNIYANVDTEWREYKFGPVAFVGTSDTVGRLIIDKQGVSNAGPYFIDNITVTSVGSKATDYIYLIKDSWKTAEGYDVPQVCDSTPTDAFPGEHLGCKLYDYTRAPKESIALNGFDKLCRSEAVGCTAVVDTYNTVPDTTDGVDPTHKLAYDILCQDGFSGDNTTCSVSFAGEAYTCSLEVGKKSCYLEGPIDIGDATYSSTDHKIYDLSHLSTSAFAGQPSPRDIALQGINTGQSDVGYIATSTVIVPADSDVQYLTQFNIGTGDTYLCNQTALGCQEVGQELQSLPGGEAAYDYSVDYLRVNDPSLYATTLCTGEQEGCSQFSNTSQVSYFKDPLLSGRPLCTYEHNVDIGGVDFSGWFMESGIGLCSAGGADDYCREDADCPGDSNICNTGNRLPCYKDYLQPGNEYGLWSNASPNYDNFVGTCDISQNGCIELIDPADTSNTGGEGKKYYVIDNDNLYTDIDECKGGQVSQKEGCILFDKTSDPNKIYDSAQTYIDSTNDNYNLVDAVRVDPTVGDSNMVLKVIRDRQCSEWLECRSSVTTLDEFGKSHELCQEYQACSELTPEGDCATWVRTREDNERLTESKYIKRGVTWYDSDYTGYSLFNKYNPSNFTYLIFPGHDDAYLGYEVNKASFFPVGTEDEQFGCAELDGNDQHIKEDGQECGYDGGGRCYNQRCLYPIDGIFTSTYDAPVASETSDERETRTLQNIEKVLEGLTQATCKNFPEPTAPFDSKLITTSDGKTYPEEIVDGGKYRTEFNNRLRPFEHANVCQVYTSYDGEQITDCSCDYFKVEYKDGTIDYWSAQSGSNAKPHGICVGGGGIDGNPCQTDDECMVEGSNVQGTCNLLTKQGRFIGQKGLCLEYDLSRPLTKNKDGKEIYEQFACLTWLPIQVSASALDLYNADLEAGYYPVEDYDSEFGGLSYCTESTSYDRAYYNEHLLDGEYGNTSLDPENHVAWLDRFVIKKGVDDEEDIKYEQVFSGRWNVSPHETTYTPYGTHYGYTGSVQGGDYNYDDLISESSKADNPIYNAMQAWTWSNISPYSRVLRVDAINDYYIRRFGDCDNNVDLGGDSYMDAFVFNFAPRLNHDDESDTGTLMHPPRMWNKKTNGQYETFDAPSCEPGNRNYVMNARVDKGAESGPGYDGTANNRTGAINLAETSMLSPEASNNNKYVFIDNDAETQLNKNDIKQLYFVPIAYPNGMQGPAPSLLSKDFSIPFDILSKMEASEDFSTTIGIDTDVPCMATDDNNGAFGGDHGIGSYGGCDNGLMVNAYYKLNRVEDESNCNGLLSFCDYDSAQPHTLDDYKNEHENKIYSRYVSLFYRVDPGALTRHDFRFHSNSNDIPMPTTETDPFMHVCNNGDGNNWLAVGLDFNEDGDFLGYISRWCMGSSGESGIRFAVVAELYDQCTEFTAVVNHENQQVTGDYNKAWTDRVWAGARTDGIPIAYSRHYENENPGLSPYGSLPGIVNYSNIVQKSSYLNSYTFSDFKLGIPYHCGGSAFDRFWSGSVDSDAHINSGGCNTDILDGDDPSYGMNLPNNSVLSNLFKKYYAVYDLYDDDVDPRSASLDESHELEGTQTPHIYAINYAACDAGKCTAAERDNFTINKRNYTLTDYNDDNAADEDQKRNGSPDPIIAHGTYSTLVQFYAVADDNHMPIRRVMVDWGDGTEVTNNNRSGLYKNRKPFCAGEDGMHRRCATPSGDDTLLTCDSDDDCMYAFGDGSTCTDPVNDDNDNTNLIPHFGDADRACKSEYFEFTHMYYCDAVDAQGGMTPEQIRTSYEGSTGITNPMFPSQEAALEAYDRLIEQNVRPTDSVCVFKPGVQILDNWGWCNGVGLDGSYIEGYNGIDLECDYMEDNLTFTPYQGAIILIPQQDDIQ